MPNEDYNPKTETIAALAALRSATAMLAGLGVPLERVQDFVRAAHVEQQAAQLEAWPTTAEPTPGDAAAEVLRCLGLPQPATRIVPTSAALDRAWSLWAEGFRRTLRGGRAGTS